MISSEVQRTLVKSPPELWAELSDPKSLARHLGELGEIRITRAEPEKLVEWEAEQASGSVAIKASGWGTKVTLKASREFTPPEPEDTEPQDLVPEETEPQDLVPEDTEPQALVPEETEPQDVEPEEPKDPMAEPEASGPLPALEDDSNGTPQTPSGLDAWSRQEAELTVTAAERFDHEHSATLLGSDLQLAAGRDLEAPQAAGEAEHQEQQQDSGEPAPEAEAPAPRIGFFARLFGRGRRNRAASPLPSLQARPADPPALEAESGPEPVVAPVQDPVAAEGSSAAEEPLVIVEPAAEVEALPAEEPQLEPESEPAPLLESEPEPEPQLESEPEPQPVIDLAAELRAAEEAAEEEVRTILTGVLDRLGAAHHRPFSRA